MANMLYQVFYFTIYFLLGQLFFVPATGYAPRYGDDDCDSASPPIVTLSPSVQPLPLPQPSSSPLPSPEPLPAEPLLPGDCPPDTGKQRVVDGITYQVLCHEAYSTGRFIPVSDATEELCIKACSAEPTCQGANFNTEDHSCELHPEWQGQPRYTGDTTYWISFRPIVERPVVSPVAER